MQPFVLRDRAPSAMTFSYPKIVLVGDSLTQLSFCPYGIGAQLAHAYCRKADILNRGVSGYNSRWLLPLFRDTLTQFTLSDEVLLYILWLGTNDACLPGYPHHVPLSEFKENLRTMITELRTHPITQSSKVLVITPPPIYAPLLRKSAPREGKDRDYKVTRQYADAALTVANDFHEDGGIAAIDFHNLIELATSYGCSLMVEIEDKIVRSALNGIFTDGLHLGWKGYDILYKEIVAEIGRQWPELTSEKVPFTAVWWGDLVKDGGN
ncbi:SGNH hydrolase-type esterase domain-containing protein [Terfezia claveryi]|nr:SGNH hydrolase-type esterase domain-containing protein [Terfezia claveryi]